MFFSKTLCKPLSPAFYLLSLFLLFASFHKEASAQSVDDNFLPTFGNGKTKIRLYTDYFCGPCSHLEPQIEGLLKTLIEKHLITVTFIDVPFSKYSSMYVKHFLYALNEKRSPDYAFKVRRVLFNAAKEKISDPKGLVSYLKGHNINIKPFDERGIYEVFEHYLNKEDKINATPTCVIMEGGKKEIFKGVSDITNALKRFM